LLSRTVVLRVNGQGQVLGHAVHAMRAQRIMVLVVRAVPGTKPIGGSTWHEANAQGDQARSQNGTFVTT